MPDDNLPQPPRESIRPQKPEDDKPGTNEIRHQPDPKAEPMPGMSDDDQRYHPRSPYTHGND